MQIIEALQAEKRQKEQEIQDLSSKIQTLHQDVFRIKDKIDALQSKDILDAIKPSNYYTYTYKANGLECLMVIYVIEAKVIDGDSVEAKCETVLIIGSDAISYDRTSQLEFTHGVWCDESHGYLSCKKLKPATQEDMHSALLRCIDFMTTQINDK